ncbi:hypothetical protein GALL_82360 [mine drainage metagenome]|uniref:Uncharacterized protein n=1 Tax=mine drainage metagenome TaxID=410659 RepID=A0A1J5TCJ3_9ZZZZ
MISEDKIVATHQALGEFVVIFQWVENLYRQIGWFILDPERKDWPPIKLRRETNCQLIDKVTDMFVSLTQTYALDNGDEKAKDILELKGHFHELRRYRNRVLHSTYVELNGGGEVHGYIRSNPDVGVDPETGDLIFDQEDFTAEAIYSKIREYGDYMLRLNLLHVQLVHWAPFALHGSKTGAYQSVPQLKR